MFLHKNYIVYSAGVLKRIGILKILSANDVQEIEKFLKEMNMHVENSIKEAMSHNSSYSALADIMTEHPRGLKKSVELKRWAIDLLHQLKELDSAVIVALRALDSHKKHKEETTTASHLTDSLKQVFTDIDKYSDYSTKFSNSLAKEEEAVDHIDHVKVKQEVVHALLDKQHLNKVYVDNIISWF